LWDIVEKTVTIPTDAQLLDEFNKNDVKSNRIICDSIKFHAIPCVNGKNNAFDKWEYLTNLYQSENKNRKMWLREN
jgi:hypothetical protein